VEKQRNDPVSRNWKEEGEVEVGNIRGERLDWRECVGREWREVGQDGIVGDGDVRHDCEEGITAVIVVRTKESEEEKE